MSHFQFLQGEFLGYLERWKANVEEKQITEGLTAKECSRMFLSHQTYEGIKTTGTHSCVQYNEKLSIIFLVHSFVEATKFLLQNGCKFVLPRRMSQDPLEEHFGRHRMLASRNKNPTLHAYG